MYKRALLLFTAVGVILGTGVVVALGATSASARSTTRASTTSIITSDSGGPVGYAAVPKSGGATAFRYVAATFTLPRTYCSNGGGGSLTNFVVGLGGTTTNPLEMGAGDEEAGVYTSCDSNGNNSYVAGYCQAVTRDGCYQPQSTFKVTPGDSIFASVYYNASNKKYTYYVHDIDTSKSLKVILACASGCTNNSAAVSADDPYGGPYSTFSEVNFAAARATDTAGDQAGLVSSYWNTVAQDSASPDQYPPVYGPIYTSNTSPTQSAFEVYYSKPS